MKDTQRSGALSDHRGFTRRSDTGRSLRRARSPTSPAGEISRRANFSESPYIPTRSTGLTGVQGGTRMSATRLTALDVSFLEVESPSAHMHVGWAALFDEPRGRARPTFEELRDHVAGRMSRAPRYRQKLAEVPLGVNDPVWVDDDQFDISRHVRHSTSPDFDEVVDEVMSDATRSRPPAVGAMDRRPAPRWTDRRDRQGAPRDGRRPRRGGAGDGASGPHPRAAGVRAPIPGARQPAGRLAAAARRLVDRAGEVVALATWPLGFVRRPTRLVGAATAALQSARALADSLRSATPETGLNEPISPRRHLARAHRPWATSSTSRAASTRRSTMWCWRSPPAECAASSNSAAKRP